MKSFRCSLKDILCLLLGSEVNAITWLVFLTLHRNQSGCSFSHCPPPLRGVMQTEAALLPKHPGDITALVKQKRNPACGSCSLKKISAVRPHRGKYISIWLKVAFIVKYVGGKKCSFTRLAFHLLSDAFLGCPEAGFLIFILHVRTSWGRVSGPPMLCWEQERARQREAERKRPSLTAAPLKPCTHAPLQFPPRRTFSWSQQKSAPSGCFCAARKGRHSEATFISTRMAGAWTGPALAPRTPTDRHSWKKAYAPVSCATPAVTLMTKL